VTTPDDVRAAYAAMINQIPPTMESSIGVLSMLSSLGPVKGADGQISVEKLQAIMARVAATLTFCVLTLDNKVERLEGRPGIPDDSLEAIRREFLLGS
jgi:hypothetical protein